MEENFRMEWNMEWKIFGMEWKKIASMEYGKIVLYFISYHALLMRPFPASQSNNVTTQVFNYRLSRARSVVENAFGVLAARWRVFHSKIAVSSEHAYSIVKASFVLHNFRQTRSGSLQLWGVMEDALTAGAADGLGSMQHIGGRPGEAASIRNKFTTIFLQDNAVPWQIQHVRRRSSMDV